MTSLVVTILGPDRVGLVQALSETVERHDANWLESRMAQLAGQFAGLLRISVPAPAASALIDSLSSLEGLQIHVTRVDAAENDHRRTVHLEVVGNDRPGIVRQIGDVLLRQGVNVEELETECVPAPMTGEPLFQARAELRASGEIDEDALREALEGLSNDLIVTLES